MLELKSYFFMFSIYSNRQTHQFLKVISPSQITYPRNTPYPEFDKDENQKRMESIIEEVGLKEFVAKQGGLQQT